MSKKNTYVVAVDKSASKTITTLSSPILSQTALAKFNRIIDNTVVPSSNYCYTSKLIPSSTTTTTTTTPITSTIVEKSKSLLPESIITTIGGGNNLNKIVNGSYMENLNKISSDSICVQQQQQQQPTLSVLNNPNEINKQYTSSNYYNNYYTYDNQTKRNDVHYLLKQLNSFSDIEEIEIADMKKSMSTSTSTSFSIVNRTASAIAAAAATCGIRTTPTPTSTINYNKYYDAVSYNNGQSYNQIPQQQNDYDYNLFQSCHYLETSCFATTITTAIAGSNSHEFRPSHSTNSSSLNEYGTCTAAGTVVIPFVRHSNGIAPPRTRQPCSSGNSPCSIDLPTFLPSSHSPQPHYSEEIYSTTSRLSGSGGVIQTELSSSLSAKNYSTNSSLGDTASDERHKPFFKCCYTPIDRWRQKRSHANANTSNRGGSGNGGVGGTNAKPNSHKSGVGNV